MELILKKDVANLGFVDDVVTVKNGYGRNFLIPQEMAVRATKENTEKFSSIKKDLENKNQQELSRMNKILDSLKNKHLTFVAQSGADGKLFGSISVRLIASSLSDLTGHKLNYSNIIIDEPIKFNGVFKVQVMLHPEIFTSVLVVVAKSDLEAQNALQEYKNSISQEKAKKDEQQELRNEEVTSEELPKKSE